MNVTCKNQTRDTCFKFLLEIATGWASYGLAQTQPKKSRTWAYENGLKD